MNFLAHIYLSFGDEEVTIGNFIADNIRGNNYTHLPLRIQQGILLHREIDTYTDSHPVARRSSKRLHPGYSHYSRVIVDIYYDHFLAKNWEQYSPIPLESFVADFYGSLSKWYDILPSGVKRLMPYMIADNWLLNYAKLEGIEQVLQGMNRRTENKSHMHLAIAELQQYYEDFESEFTLFFEELITFSREKYTSLCTS